MSAPHDDLVRSIRLYISSIGGISIHTQTPGLLFDRHHKPVKIGTKGTLDVHACIKGRFVTIDAKIGRDKLKPDQQNYANAVIDKGGVAFAAWSVADVTTKLTAEGLI